MIKGTDAEEHLFRSLESFKNLAVNLKSHRHAGMAMIVAAALDRLLEDALLTKMVKLSEERRKKLFGDYGTLRSFDAKIKVAFAFAVIDRETSQRLTIIRKIRNKFAHTEGFLDFNSPEIKSILSTQRGSISATSSMEFFFSTASLIESSIVKATGLADRNLMVGIMAARREGLERAVKSR